MPVDFFPVMLGAAFIGTLIITAFSSLGKRPKRTWFVGLLVAGIFPTACVWIYHRTEVRFSLGAARGEVEALYRLGNSHMSYARGASYDPPRGRTMLLQAAEKGHSSAQLALGAYYLCGLSTPQDKATALKWFRRAAQQGDQRAEQVIEEVARDGYDADYPSGIACQILMTLMDD